MLDEACDWDRRARAGMIGNEAEGGEAQLGDRAVKLGESVCVFADDDHRSGVSGLRLAA
jgi:hypothetical protein